jgi:methylmalonyl-CoA/ethylmalonyl-CoA epimerase
MVCLKNDLLNYLTNAATGRPMSSIDGIAQIAISVSDIPRATGFYRDVLGLKFLMSPSPQMAFFDCGGVRVLLGTQGGKPGALGTLVYFRTRT